MSRIYPRAAVGVLVLLAGLLVACGPDPTPTVPPIVAPSPEQSSVPQVTSSPERSAVPAALTPSPAPSLVPSPSPSPVAPLPSPTQSMVPPAAPASPTPAATVTPWDAGLPPPPTYRPEPAWPSKAVPTPFAPPTAIPGAAALALPAAPPLSAFAADLRPASAGDLAGQEQRSVYQIALRLDLDAQQLLGRERVTLTNQSAVPLTQVVLRLYPNFPGIEAERQSATGFPRLQVGAAVVGDAPADVGYLDHNTAVAIILPAPLAPGARQSVEIQFRLSTAGLGPARDMAYFKSFYPLLAVYDSGGWRLDVTAFPDEVYAESSFYAVDFDAPANLVLASSGTEIGHTASGDRVVHHILAGPVREFAATAGRRYTQATRAAGDVTVRVTSLLTDTAQARQDLDIAASALTVYGQTFGAYPFNELDVLLTPDGSGGIEYPGYVMISNLPNVEHVREHVVSHEVAHQWWYSLVGDDIFREPWLDESFADYSTYIFLQQTAGDAVADDVFENQTAYNWPDYDGAVRTANPFGGKRVGSAIWEFRDFEEYDGIIYGKGPVFLDRLRRLLGDARFFRLLQLHYQANKYGVTTGRTFLHEARQVAGADAAAVTTLYLQWVEGRQ